MSYGISGVFESLVENPKDYTGLCGIDMALHTLMPGNDRKLSTFGNKSRTS